MVRDSGPQPLSQEVFENRWGINAFVSQRHRQATRAIFTGISAREESQLFLSPVTLFDSEDECSEKKQKRRPSILPQGSRVRRMR